MSILTLQRRMRQLGKIRTGHQVASGGGRKRPAKLETFRLTSPSRGIIEAAAEAYGGKIVPWPERDEWQVITQRDTLDIVVPPGQALSQWFELWSGGGCQRRCDGMTEVISGESCLCPPDALTRRDLAAEGKACKPTTRLNVILPDLPDIGVFLLEAHGFYAAVELAGTAEFLERATAAGRLIPARLRLDQRERKTPGKPVAKYAVPVIELPQTRIADLIALDGGSDRPALPEPVNQRQRVERPVTGSEPPPLPSEAFVKPDVPFGGEPEPEMPFAPLVDGDGVITPMTLDEFKATGNVTKGAMKQALAKIHGAAAIAWVETPPETWPIDDWRPIATLLGR